MEKSIDSGTNIKLGNSMNRRKFLKVMGASVFIPMVAKDVKDHGAVGDGVIDDAAAIQAMIDNSALGDEIYLSPGTYLVTGLRLLKGRAYRGAHYQNTIIKLADNANPDAVLASDSYMQNWQYCAAPIQISNLYIDGNKENNSTGHGLLLTNWNASVDKVWVMDVAGDGIRFSDTTANGEMITNSMVENRITQCRVFQPDGYGIYINDTGGNITDGYLTDNIVSYAGKSGIRFDDTSGWAIVGNHSHRSGWNGIDLRRCRGTRIIGNYIDHYGKSPMPEKRSGLRVSVQSGRGAVISSNSIGLLEREITENSTYNHLEILAEAGIDAQAICGLNEIRGANIKDETGLVLWTQSGGTLAITLGDNHISNCDNLIWTGEGVTINDSIAVRTPT